MNDKHKENSTIELLQFISEYIEQYRKAEAKLPYRINVFDELRISRGDAKVLETAHSRILTKLLQYKAPCGKFELFESLIQYIAREKSDSYRNINVINPNISREEGNIDVYIRDSDGKYAVIVENKINFARPTERQLPKYIERTREIGFSAKQIYIIYLPRTNDKKKQYEQRLEEYKDIYSERFVIFSFKEDVLRWLKEIVLPIVNQKNILLSSALEQYIDHLQEMSLDGKTDSQDINQKIIIEMENFIKEKLKLNGNLLGDYKKISNQQKIIKDLFEYFKNENVNKMKQLAVDWIEFLKPYKEIEPADASTDKQVDLTVKISLGESKNCMITLGAEFRHPNFYCGVWSDPDPQDPLPDAIIQDLKSLSFENKNDGSFGKLLESGTFEELYEEGRKLLEAVIGSIEKYKKTV